MTDKFTGGGLDSLTKAAYEAGYEDGVAAERKRGIKALKKYGGHFPMCSANVMLMSMPPQRKPCDCGLEAAIRARGEQK